MDREILERLLKGIGFSLNIARSIVGRDLSEFISDIRNRYTLRLALIEIVEAPVTLGIHILRWLGERSIEGYTHLQKVSREKSYIGRSGFSDDVFSSFKKPYNT